MSKSTAAVIMVSAAKLSPWGDEGWRFSGAMQLVHDGPDWLYAQWPVLDGAEHHGSDRFATLVLHEDVGLRAADIAVMTFALLQVPEWPQLMPWWEPSADREALMEVLHGVARQHAQAYKLAVVQTGSIVRPELIAALAAFGFDIVAFAPVGTAAQHG